MTIEFRCRQCDRLLRTDDDTVGRMAQCPACAALTQVPEPDKTESNTSSWQSDAGGPSGSASPEPASSAGNQSPYQTTAGSGPGYSGNTLYALKRISAPATCLLVTAMLGLLLHVVGIFGHAMHFGHVMPPDFHKQLIPAIFMTPIATVFGVIGLIMSILLLIGAIKMKALENYGLAMTASIIAMIPCTSPCCFLGLPFGIWALVVLSDPVVKASFKR
jgi:phage FluMu protein Com